MGDFCVDDPCYIFVYPKAVDVGPRDFAELVANIKNMHKPLNPFCRKNAATLREKECGLVGKNFSVDER